MPAPDPADSTQRADGLEQALAAYVATRDDPAARSALLDSHPELREWLEPLLASEGETASAAAGLLAADERTIGDYRLIGELGRGGMGIVYAAWQRSLGRKVAVKLLASGLGSNPSAVSRFRREAAAAGRLRHPGIVEVHDCGSVDGEHFIAMELVEGEPLHRCLDRFAEPRAAAALALQLAEALAHAHAAGLVHRDVKPANILIRPDGRAALSDFGLASDAALPSLTKDGAFLGTLDYASPEQIRGEPTDARADVFAVGVVLAEVLAGEHPFRGPTQAATTARILGRDAALVGRAGARLPRDLAAIVDRALARERHHRYASAQALALDLRAFLDGNPVSARLPNTIERLWRASRREPWRATAVLALLLGVPTLAAVGGHLAAKAPAIAAGEATLEQQRREQELAQLWLDYTEGATQDLLDRLLAATPVDDELRAMRCLTLWNLERHDEALAMARSFDSPVSRTLQALIEGPYDAAKLMGIAGADPLAWYALALHHYAAGRNGPDRAQLQLAWQYTGTAIQLAPRPRHAFLLTHALAAARAGDAPAAARARVALNRHFAGTRATRNAEAVLAAELGEPDAIARYEQLVAEAPREAKLQHALGVTYERAGQLAAAEAQYRRATELDPQLAASWNNLGMLRRRQGDEDGAIAAYRQAIAAAPQHVRSWANLGNALSKRDPEAAKAAYERALQLRPNYALGHYNLGLLHQSAGNWDAAIASYRRSSDLDPRHAPSHNNLGIVLWEQGQTAEAHAAAQRALALAPKDVRFLGNVFGSAFALDEIATARQVASRWTEAEARSPLAWTACVVAHLAGNLPEPATASSALARLGGLEPPPHLRALAEALVALHAGDKVAAARHAAAAQAALAGVPPPPLWFTQALDRLQQRLGG